MRLRSVQHIFKATEAESERIDLGARLAQMKFSAWARSVLLREVDRLETEHAQQESSQAVTSG